MKIYCDVDSVLAAIDEIWCFWMRQVLGISIESKDILFWNFPQILYGSKTADFWKLDFIYNYCRAIPGAKKFIGDCIKLVGKDNVILITDTEDHLKLNKEKWIKIHIADIKIIHTKDKWEHTTDGILIDDRFENVVLHKLQNNKPAVLFNYNESYRWVSNFRCVCEQYGIQYKIQFDDIINYLKRELL